MAERVRTQLTIDTGSSSIVTTVEGDGPAFVILPSYGRDGLGDFDVVSEAIAASGWRVIRPQPRGVSGSTGSMMGLDMTDLAADVAGVIRAVAGGSAVVLGHAYGNMVARVLAVESPSAVRGVVLAAASCSHVAPDIDETPFVAGDPKRSDDERLAALHKAFFAPGHDARPWLRGWYADTLAMQRAAAKATDLEPYWAGGSAPILEINARYDPFKPEACWPELRDAIGDRAETVLVDDAAHALFPEQPDAVIAALRAWLPRFEA